MKFDRMFGMVRDFLKGINVNKNVCGRLKDELEWGIHWHNPGTNPPNSFRKSAL